MTYNKHKLVFIISVMKLIVYMAAFIFVFEYYPTVYSVEFGASIMTLALIIVLDVYMSIKSYKNMIDSKNRRK